MEQTHGSWGNRTRIFDWDGGLVTYLDLVPNQRCSWHFHKHTFNKFYVIDGVLFVKTDKGYITELTKGQSFTVEPEVKHEFQTHDVGARVVEVAWVEYDYDDIFRQTLGGKLTEHDKEATA